MDIFQACYSIFYMNSKGDWIFEQNGNSDYFWVRYKDIQEFIKYMVEEAFKSKY